MKKQVLLFATILLLSIQSYAQTGVAINNTGNDAHNSAMLDVSSTEHGILIPRMTEAQRINIALLVKGLLVYQNDGIEGFYYYDGSVWTRLAAGTVTGVIGTAPVISSGGDAPVISITPATSSTAGSMSAADKSKLDGVVTSQWTKVGSDIYYNTGNIGIGVTSPNAPLQLSSSTNNRKIVLYENENNDHEFYGLGVNDNIFRYQVKGTAASHVFYTGTSETTSLELFRIKGTGQIAMPALNTPGVMLNNASGEISSTDGTNGQMLTTDGSGGISWATPYSGLTNFTESSYTYDTKTGVKLLARNDILSNVDFIISPKGTGAIVAQQPDGTTAGGNNRGINAVDLQTSRAYGSDVASGNYATITGGKDNRAHGEYSVVSGGFYNYAEGSNSTVSGGFWNYAKGENSTVSGGFYNYAKGGYSTVSGGHQNKASGSYSFVSGGQSNYANGDYSVVVGGYHGFANSYGETVLGLFATNAAGTADSYVYTDRLFAIGNGTGDAQRSDAFTILKNGNTTVSGSFTINVNRVDSSYIFPIERGINGQVLTTDGSGEASWISPYSGLTNFTESSYTYDTKTGVKLLARNDILSNVDFIISPKGTGAIIAQQPDGTTAGGNNRGIGSIDLQMSRTDASQVASGRGSVIVGGEYNAASGDCSIAMGRETRASGHHSTAMGYNNEASGIISTVMGNQTLASGKYSTAMGARTTAPSAFETVIGRYNTEYTPAETMYWNSNDRLFVVGNGSVVRSDAFTILKNANTTIGGSLTVNTNKTDSSYTFPIERGINGQMLATDGSGTLLWTTPVTNLWESNGADVYLTSGNVGIGVSTPHALLHISNEINNRKIVLYENQDNDHEFYGLGINSYTLRYQIPASTASHVFYSGTSETTSTELFRIKGTGEIVIPTFTTQGIVQNSVTGILSTTKGTANQVLKMNTDGTATEWGNVVTTYQVSDFAQGGIVFWVDETGQHGLVTAKEDQNTAVRWNAGTFGSTQAKGDGPFAGEANTSIIIAAHIAIGDDGSTYAARICNELQITEGGKTYGDWYLPSKEELNLMYQNKSTINATATANGGSSFSNNDYWSSTEKTTAHAWDQDFTNGLDWETSKAGLYHVRAIRAF